MEKPVMIFGAKGIAIPALEIFNSNEVVVYGHTDRLGSDAYNMDLSQRRADAVRALLVQQGVPSHLIRAQGMGKNQPVVQCENANRNELVACLAPNRRVEVTVNGSGLVR